MIEGKRVYISTPPRNRRDDPPITLFLGTMTQDAAQPLHCIHCGLQFGATRNQVLFLVFNEGYIVGKQLSSFQRCKRCKQEYHLVV